MIMMKISMKKLRYFWVSSRRRRHLPEGAIKCKWCIQEISSLSSSLACMKCHHYRRSSMKCQCILINWLYQKKKITSWSRKWKLQHEKKLPHFSPFVSPLQSSVQQRVAFHQSSVANPPHSLGEAYGHKNKWFFGDSMKTIQNDARKLKTEECMQWKAIGQFCNVYIL